MFSIKLNDNPDVIELEIDGKITANEVKEFDNFFHQQKGDQDEINLLMTIKDLGYSVDGLIEDFKFDINHFNDFNKIAVVSNKKWIEVGSKLFEPLPNVDVKYFKPDEKDKAEAWLN